LKPRIQTRKMLTAGMLLVIAGMLARFAWVSIRETYSVALIILAAIVFLGGIALFAMNLRE
jgi:hypothetical protein